jgi:hypothetical protein
MDEITKHAIAGMIHYDLPPSEEYVRVVWTFDDHFQLLGGFFPRDAKSEPFQVICDVNLSRCHVQGILFR